MQSAFLWTVQFPHLSGPVFQDNARKSRKHLAVHRNVLITQITWAVSGANASTQDSPLDLINGFCPWWQRVGLRLVTDDGTNW